MKLVDTLLLQFGYSRIPSAQPSLPETLVPQSFEKADTRESLAANPMAQAYLSMNSQYGLRKASNITMETLRRMSINNWVDRTCIETLRDEITSIPWDIVPINPKKPIAEGLQKYLVRLLKKPNKNNENWRTLIQKTVEDILVIDAGVWEKVRDQAGRIVEIWQVDGATIKPIFDEKGRMGSPAYKQYMPGKQTNMKASAQFENTDMVYMMWNPQGSIQNYGFGLSPVEAGLAVGTAFLYAEAYNLGFFQTNTIPGTIISLGKNASPAQIDSFRSFLASDMQGLQGFHQPVITSSEDIKVTKMFEKPEEMAWAKYVEWQMRWKVALYRMSPQDIGFSLDQYKVEGQIQQQLSKNKAINSLKNIIAEYINTEIIGDDGWRLDEPNLKFEWIDSMMVDPLIQAQVDKIYLDEAVYETNHVRERLGLDPILGGTKPLLQSTAQPIPLSTDVIESKDLEKSLKMTQEGEICNLSGNPTAIAFMDDRGVNQPLFITDYGRSRGLLIKSTFLDDRRGQELPEEEVATLLRLYNVKTPEVKIMSYDEVLKLIPIEVYPEFTKWLRVESPYFSQTWIDRWGKTRKSEKYIVTGFLTGRSFCDDSLCRDMKMNPDAYNPAINDLARMWLAERKLLLGDRKPGHYIISNDGHAYGVDYQFYGNVQDWKKTCGSLIKTLENIHPRLKKMFEQAVQAHFGEFSKSSVSDVVINKALKKKSETGSVISFDLNEYEKKFAETLQLGITKFFKNAVHLSGKNVLTKALEFDEEGDYVSDGDSIYQAQTRYPLTVLPPFKRPSFSAFLFEPLLYRSAVEFGIKSAAQSITQDARSHGVTKIFPTLKPDPVVYSNRHDYLQESMGKTISEGIQKIIQEETMKGTTYAEIGERIQNFLAVDPTNPDIPLWRAENIARTESQWAINEGIRQEYKSLGFERMNLSLAPNACDECQSVYDEGPYSIEQEDILPVHPNCRCSFINLYSDLPE